MTLTELKALAKQGDTSRAYAELTAKPAEEISSQKENAGWIIFYHMRGMISQHADIATIKEIVEKYNEIQVARPSLLHSNMLRLAGKACEYAVDADMTEIMEVLGTEFRDEDYRPTTYNGREIAPLFDSVVSDCFEQKMEFGPTFSIFGACNASISHLLDLYARCIYRRLWQYNSEEDDEKKSYALVNKYLEETIAYDRKGKMHSTILYSILWDTHDETTGWFKEVFEKWGMDSFMPEDWQKVRKGEETYPSLAEKAIGKYIQSLKARNLSPAPEFSGLVDTALTHFPNDETLLRYSARYKMQEGKKEEAQALYRRMIITGNKYYLWSELAAIVDDEDLRLGCLAKAVLMQRDENFLGNIRLELARIFISRGLHEAALLELDIHEETYRRNEWGRKNSFVQLRSRIPAGTTAAKDNMQIYKSYTHLCDEFIYSTLPVTEAVMIGTKEIEIQGKKKRRIVLKCQNGESIMADPVRCGVKQKCMVCDLFEIRIDRSGKRPKVVWMKAKGKVPYERVTVSGIDQARGIFFFTGEDGSKGKARIDKCRASLQIGTPLDIARYSITGDDGRTHLTIIDTRPA